MEVAGITNLKRFVDDFFGKSDKSSYTSQDSDKADPKRLFSHLKRECAESIWLSLYRRGVLSFT